MSIESADFHLIKEKLKGASSQGKCAILGDCKFRCVDSKVEFQRQTGFDCVDTFDINGEPTHRIDLNETIPEQFVGQYDWVIDSGTLYCCFDIATVMRNIVSMLKPGGYVLHTGNLAGFFGRGYYSLSPAFFSEFYTVNGFDILHMGTRTRSCSKWHLFPPMQNYLLSVDNGKIEFTSDMDAEYVPNLPNDSMICCLAKKEKEQVFTKPIPEHFVLTGGK